VVWGTTVVWGNSVGGSTVVWGNTAVIWGISGNAVWDDPNPWATTVVWGNSLVSFANGPVGPTTVVWGNLAQ
jgi:hypothetical protein